MSLFSSLFVPLETASSLGLWDYAPEQSLATLCPAGLCPEICPGLPEPGPVQGPHVGAADWVWGQAMALLGWEQTWRTGVMVLQHGMPSECPS